MLPDEVNHLLLTFSSSRTLGSRLFGGCCTFGSCYTLLRFVSFDTLVSFDRFELAINLCNLVLHLLQLRFSIFASLGESFPLFFHHFLKRLRHGFPLRIRRNPLTLVFL